jgi:ABC-type Mn2+/Zn2+ transport system permease subunit
MEFMRRLAITLFFMSVILIFPLATNFKGSGLSQYTASGSFTIMLAKFTLGNLSNASRQDYLIITVTDVLSMVVLLVFYIHWRHFHRTTIQEFNANHATLNPASYAVSVE